MPRTPICWNCGLPKGTCACPTTKRESSPEFDAKVKRFWRQIGAAAILVTAFWLIMTGLEPTRPEGTIYGTDADGNPVSINCDLVISQLQPVCRGEPQYWMVAAGIVLLFTPLYKAIEDKKSH